MASRNTPARTPAAPNLSPPVGDPPAQTTSRKSGLVAKFSAKYGIDAERMLTVLKNTAFRQRGKNGGPPPEITNEQMFALLAVADRYGLDPFVKEIYAFPLDAGGIAPIVGIDGWLNMINRNDQFDYMQISDGEPSFELQEDEEDLTGAEKFARVIGRGWLEVTIKRKDRTQPTVHREYLRECYRDTGPWNSHPHRMLEWKATIQAARIAFGYTGIYDEDEAQRIAEANSIPGEVVPNGKPAVTTPQPTGGAVPALTHIPLDAWRAQIDRIGIGEKELCERFEVPTIEDFALKDAQRVQDYLDTVERTQAGG